MNLLDRPLALFYDATRARVLDALLSSSEAMSGRQIARQTNLSPTTANGALAELENRGFVRSRPHGRANLWSLQGDNKLVQQIRMFARVQDEIAGEVVADALGSEPISITLFGSTARGESGANSDVDLLIVSKDRQQDLLFRRRAFVAEKALHQIIGRPVEVTVVRKDTLSSDKISGFVRAVMKDGRTLRGSSIEKLVS
ncbi:MAG: nucleotidyltransferase domain-containing protein [Actinomycetota bacterium]